MGMMGNKGGATIRMQLHDTTICFVAAHLAAHRDNVAGRNADFANIIQKTQFELELPPKQELDDMGDVALDMQQASKAQARGHERARNSTRDL